MNKRELVIYIAGPFRGNSSWAIEQNIRRAEELALRGWQDGFSVICPHTNTRFYQGALPDNAWLDGDLAIISKCDAVLLTPDWRNSKGATAEVAFADKQGIPVFEYLTELNYAYSEALVSRRGLVNNKKVQS